MAPRDISPEDEAAYPHIPADDLETDAEAAASASDEALDDPDSPPGELLAEELTDPGAYEIAPDEDTAEELDEVDVDEAAEADDEDVEIDDPVQLDEAESLAAKARQSRPKKRSAVVEKKGAPTPKAHAQRQTVRSKRTTPVQFASESVDELKKVVWPTWLQVRQYFVAVLVLVSFVMLYVGLIDLGVGALLLAAFGRA